MSELLLAAAILGGAAATYFLDDDASLPARLCMGTPIGIVALGLVGYILGWAFGLSMATTLAATAIVSVTPWIVLSRRRGLAAVREDLDGALRACRESLRHPRTTIPTVVFFAVMTVVMGRLLDRAMFEAPEGGGVFTGVDHNLGDLPFHLAIVTSFLYGHNFPPEHPELAGTRLTYPFLVDLVAAMLISAGASVRRALLAENLALGWALVGLLHRFALRVTRDRLAALLAPLLVIASGGLGFLWLAEDVDPEAGLVGLLSRPPHDYTILAQGPLRWGNLVITMLVPQRSFLLGPPALPRGGHPLVAGDHGERGREAPATAAGGGGGDGADAPRPCARLHDLAGHWRRAGAAVSRPAADGRAASGWPWPPPFPRPSSWPTARPCARAGSWACKSGGTAARPASCTSGG